MRLLIATDAWRPADQRRRALAGAHGGRGVALRRRGRCSSPPSASAPFRCRPTARSGCRSRPGGPRPGTWPPSMPTHVHIATEGPIGFAARRACMGDGRSFTTSYHTRFPEYLSARAPVPRRWSYAALRRFHNAGRGVMVWTPSLERGAEGPGLRAGSCAGPAASTRSCSGPAPSPSSTGRARSSSSSAGSRSRRTSRPSSASTCPAPRSWSATGRPGRTLSGRIRTPASSARFRARRSPPSTPRRTSSCSRASPTPSASCSWRRSPPACPWRPSR